MLLMDNMFVFNSTILSPISLLFGLSYLDDFIDGTYEVLFQMKRHEVSGFRRMRTITQLIFESVI